MNDENCFYRNSRPPQCGKSTLLNAMLGEKVAIVSSKPQTTRNRIIGILTQGENQFVLDLPAFMKPKSKLGTYMMKTVRSSLGSADAVILLAEAGKAPGETEINVIEHVKKEELPCILVLNKIDLINREKLAETIAQYAALHNFDAVVPVSAIKGKNVKDVLEESEKFLYESQWFLMKIRLPISRSGRLQRRSSARNCCARWKKKFPRHGCGD